MMLVIPPTWRQPLVPAERIILEGLIRAGGSLSFPEADEDTDIDTIKLLTMLTAMAIDGNVEIDHGETLNTYTITDAGRALLDSRPQ
ncbi:MULTISPECIES: hypothetical protein [unclassified Bradyrhizobium]|uniref:hypothetical protein n=1 Tax=Bradyrhizobium sp. USDA 4541 TaxID=2817704 RepID=UPI0020A40071|nr:hypothetical protein [Bradyrhizobium sp. USDA 4541]MCP1851230.1 hypothetical protein [Bradyrhizobium sp. USDA 4541]